MNEISSTATELPWLWAGLGAYALATFIVMRNVVARGAAAGAAINRSYENYVFLLLLSGVILLAVALTDRWIRIGHGPFVNLFELLISQLFSLGVIFAFTYWRFPVIRPTAVVALPLPVSNKVLEEGRECCPIRIWIKAMATNPRPHTSVYNNPTGGNDSQ